MLGTLSMISTLFAILSVSCPSRAYGSDGQKENVPSVEIAELKYDFGFAVHGRMIVHDFLFRNIYTAPSGRRGKKPVI